jgi:hypothetical protein
LAHLRKQVQTQENELAHFQHQVQTQENELIHLRGTLTARDADAVAREDEIQRLNAAMTRSTQEIKQLAAEVGKVQLTLTTVQSSASWKITRPLRAMKRVVRFLRHAPGRLARSVRRETNSLSPEMPRAVKIVRVARTAGPRLLRRAAWSFRSLFSDRYVLRETMTLIMESGLFDARFYCERNPDVAQAGVDPLVHYLSNGAAEGRDPHPLFDTSFYLESNPDVAQAGVNPLGHYLSNGAAEGRDPHPLFDTSFYLE